MFAKALAFLVMLPIFFGCTSQPTKSESSQKVTDVPELTSLLNESINSVETEIRNANGGGAEAIRLQSVKDVGFAAGVYQGRKWRQEMINSWLTDMNNWLSTNFNFEQLLIDGVYLPPRVEEIKGHVEKMEDGSIRVIRQGYRIATDAELVTSPPTHINYLYQKVDPQQPLNRLGLPEMNSNQVEVWQKAVIEGWQLGIKQANIEFEQSLNLLRRDYAGMLTYIDLVNKGVISPPKVTSSNFGVMVSADGKTLNIGDEILTIGRMPSFQHHYLWQSLSEGGDAIGAPSNE